MSRPATSARDGALAKLAAEAARFAAPTSIPAAAVVAMRSKPGGVSIVPDAPGRAHGAPAGYVPVAVAPERGNTRPVVPVDGRIHMRMAQATIAALDEVVTSWRDGDPVALRDLERATMVRVGIALLLADITQNGDRGAVGEAVRAALDPAVRHTDQPMPSLSRWLRSTPAQPTTVEGPTADRDADADPG